MRTDTRIRLASGAGLLGALALLAACDNGGAAGGGAGTDTGTGTGTGGATVTQTSDQTPLREALEGRKAEFAAKASDDVKKLYQDGIDDVVRQGAVEAAKNVGDTAPAFELPNAVGETVSLASLRADGPVVLVWYRGGWCPYCNLTLRAFQEALPRISGLGATLVAVSPERPDNALSTKEKNELAFEVLTDAGNGVAREYGVVFDLTDGVHENYNANFKLDEWNGQDSGELPLAATYVIDREGVIRWAFLDADYRARAEPADVLAALEAIR